jgi:hypothetical protein
MMGADANKLPSQNPKKKGTDRSGKSGVANSTHGFWKMLRSIKSLPNAPIITKLFIHIAIEVDKVDFSLLGNLGSIWSWVDLVRPIAEHSRSFPFVVPLGKNGECVVVSACASTLVCFFFLFLKHKQRAYWLRCH